MLVIILNGGKGGMGCYFLLLYCLLLRKKKYFKIWIIIYYLKYIFDILVNKNISVFCYKFLYFFKFIKIKY